MQSARRTERNAKAHLWRAPVATEQSTYTLVVMVPKVYYEADPNSTFRETRHFWRCRAYVVNVGFCGVPENEFIVVMRTLLGANTSYFGFATLRNHP